MCGIDSGPDIFYQKYRIWHEEQIAMVCLKTVFPELSLCSCTQQLLQALGSPKDIYYIQLLKKIKWNKYYANICHIIAS